MLDYSYKGFTITCLFVTKQLEVTLLTQLETSNTRTKNYYDVFHHPSKLIAVVCWEK